ncbi:uncharacterized protein ACB058_007881 [Synchiropus picturatus]
MGIKFSRRKAAPISSDAKGASDPKVADAEEAKPPEKTEPEPTAAATEPEKLVVEVGPPVSTDVCLPSEDCVMAEKPADGANVSAQTGDAEGPAPVDKALDPVVEKPTEPEAVPEPKATPEITVPSPSSILDPINVDKPSDVSAADEEKEDSDPKASEGNLTSPLEDLKQQASDVTQGIVTGLLEDITEKGSAAVSGLLDGAAKIQDEIPSIDINSVKELM